METFQVIRRAMSADADTLGELLIEGERAACTLELPWKDDAPNVSCIPLGTYTVKMMYSPHFKRDMPHVLGVPGRTDILFHNGNHDYDSLGCVILGMTLSGNVLIDSDIALDSFVSWLVSVGGEALAAISMAEAV
jgi:hypothetical protein